ncbi:hsp70 nucleotide exchange factor fes1 [Rhizophlyctis rosea]|nr:hsp70 nucleotide exchange factor fes1 [Rhizophlyctis rosea]
MSSRPITQAELLQWSVLNTATRNEDTTVDASEAVRNREPIDPKWLEVILGKDDAIRMRECVQTIQDETVGLDDRVTAFDELEELVESLDNANDLRPLNLWAPILAVLTSSPHDKLRLYAAWVLGTAVQNNSKAQKDFLETSCLPPVIDRLTTDPSPEVRAKILYCLSGCLSNPEIFNAFAQNNGFAALSSVFRDGDSTVVRKGLHVWMILVGCGVSEEGADSADRTREACEAVSREGVVGSVLSLLEGYCGSSTGAEEDAQRWDLVDACLRFLATFLETPGATIGEDERQGLGKLVDQIEQMQRGEDFIEGDLLQRLRRAL